MKKIIKSFGLVSIITLTIAFTAACSSLDIVGQKSITAFDAILQTIPAQVTEDEINGGWSLAAPDASVRFIWSEDYSKSPLHDIMLEMDATPFINAGLDTEKLPDNYTFYDNKLMVGTKLGNDTLTYKGESTPLASYEQIVNRYHKTVGYHTALDHYNVSLSDGNMFEWAKDMEKNSVSGENQDKDIVFVLNPEPLIEAGVNPDEVDGWIYTTVNVDMNGKATDVYKFLKPFDLK